MKKYVRASGFINRALVPPSLLDSREDLLTTVFGLCRLAFIGADDVEDRAERVLCCNLKVFKARMH